jgi:hypothetical protein
MTRKITKALKKMSDKDLQKIYDESNLVISKTRGLAKAHHLEHYNPKMGGVSGAGGAYSFKNYDNAIKRRAIALTILNQRKLERMFQSGNGGRK